MTIEIIEETPAASGPSAISWAAILGGGVTAFAITLVLFSLGSGLGFAAASPWIAAGQVAARLGTLALIWLVVTQWISAAAAGYLTGRLRTRWINIHTHEVFFRDTAHGFLAWALSTVAVATVAACLGGTAIDTDNANPANAESGYYADALYRSPARDPATLAAARDEAERLLAASAARGGLSSEDRDYLVASISARAGVSPAEAERRLTIVETDERQVVDAARKAAAALGMLTALAMCIGAFIASVAAVLGGHQRDRHA